MEFLKDIRKPLYYISFPLSFIGFILPVYVSNMGSSPVMIGMLYSVFSLFSILIRPMVGRLMDKKGRKSAFATGLLLYAGVSFLFLIGKTYGYVLAARIVQSIAASFLWVSVDTMVSDVSTDDERSRNFGIVQQYTGRGQVIGATIGFTLLFCNIFDEPFTYIFGIYFLVSILALYNGLRLCRETLNLKVYEHNEERLTDRKFIIFIIMMGILSAVQSMTAPVLLLYLKDNITHSLPMINFLFIPGAILSMFLPVKAGNLSDKWGRKQMLVTGMAAEAASILLIPLFKYYTIFMIIYTAVCAAGILRSPAEVALVSEITGDNRRGRLYGIYHFSAGIGGIVGPLAGGIIYEKGFTGMVFYIQGILMVITAVLIGILLKKADAKTTVNGIV